MSAHHAHVHVPGTNPNIAAFIVILAASIAFIAFLFRLPTWISLYSSHSLCQGWFLFSPLKLPNTSPNEPGRIRPTKALPNRLIGLRRHYNSIFLKSVPIIDLTVGQFSVILIYSIILIILALYHNTDSQSIYNFKRFGYMALAHFPITFILSMKNGPLNLIGKGYEKLNFLHRFVGRMILVFAVIHGSLLFRIQVEKSGHIHLAGSSAYSGSVAVIALFIMALTGSKIFRSYFYQTFLYIHILGYITALVAIWQHVPESHPYLAVSIAVHFFDHALRILKSKIRTATMLAMPGDLTRIEVHDLGAGWRAGQHVFLRILKGPRILEKHPFTIANAPLEDTPYGAVNSLILVAKSVGDYTKQLHRLADAPLTKGKVVEKNLDNEKIKRAESEKDNDDFNTEGLKTFKVIIEGPYGMFSTDMHIHETVVLIAGGSGFTFCMATFEDIVGSAMKGKGITQNLFVVWSIKDEGMIKAFSQAIKKTIDLAQSTSIKIIFRIHLTCPTLGNTSQQLLSAPIQVLSNRPNIKQLILEAIDATLVENTLIRSGIGVGVCGSQNMISSTRAAVAAADPQKADSVGSIVLHSEIFGL